MPRPISGRRLAPDRTRMITRMISSSGMPIRPNIAAPSSCGGSRGNSITLLVLLLLAAAAPALAQFAASTTAVEVYVSVTDAAGRPVRGLTQADFEVLEDGVPQAIGAF